MATKRKSLTVDRFFDIETIDWTQFALGVCVSRGEEPFVTRDPEELAIELIEGGGNVWSWNGGRFDLLWLSDFCLKRGYRVTYRMSGSRIAKMEVNGTTFRDAVTLIPSTLAKAAELAGVGRKGDWDHTRTRLDMPAEDWAEFERYCIRDCEIGFAALERVIGEADSRGWELTSTIGGSAWKTAMTRLGLRANDDISPREYEAQRKAYYGGRVEVFRPVAASGYRYDIHSAYPAALRSLAIPVGDFFELGKKRAGAAFANQRPGLYTARVHVPKDTFIPPLPARLPWKELAYPVGAFKGSWALPELLNAQRLGVTVDIQSAFTWEDSAPVFAELMGEVWDVRENAGTTTAFGKWLKLFANSLTGKFGEQPTKTRVHLNPTPEQIESHLCQPHPCDCDDHRRCAREFGKCCKYRCRGSKGGCKAWDSVDLAGKLWSSEFYSISPNAHVQWAAYLTSQTRVVLYNQLTGGAQGGADAVYCDTDSVYSTGPRTDLVDPDGAKTLGHWGFDGTFTDFLSIAKKVYRFTDPEGGLYLRAKGLSDITAEDFEKYVRGEVVRRENGVRTLISAARTSDSLFVRKTLTRSSRHDGYWYGGRVLSDDGRTYPVTYGALLSAGSITHRRNNGPCKSPPTPPSARNSRNAFRD